MAALKKLDAKTLPVMINRFAEARLEGIQIEMVEPGEFVKYIILFEPHPSDVVFGGHKYLLEFKAIRGDTMYPWGPPLITFITPIFHTNVSPDTGSICLSTFYDSNNGWSSALSIGSVLESIRWLLMNPETGGSHLNGEATKLWRTCENNINLRSSHPAYLNDRKKAFDTYIRINDKFYSNKIDVIRSYAKYFPELLDIQIPEPINSQKTDAESEQKTTKKLTKKQQVAATKVIELTSEEEEFHKLVVETRDAIVSKYQEKKNKAKITKTKSVDIETKDTETVPVLCSSKTSPALVDTELLPEAPEKEPTKNGTSEKEPTKNEPTKNEPPKNGPSEKEPVRQKSKKKNLWEKVID